MRLYHKDVSANFGLKFDEQIDQILAGARFINYTKHVRNNVYKAKNRRYRIEMLTLDLLKSGEVFEVGTTEDEKVLKFAVRCEFTSEQDICMVVAQDKRNKNALVAITAWLNNTNDKHWTLDVSKYCK